MQITANEFKKYVKKQNNVPVNETLLAVRAQMSLNGGYSRQKWVDFCSTLLSEGYNLKLYEAVRTFSKYITITKIGAPEKQYKVRFSNHRPIKERELKGDCDFFVGITNLTVSTTQQALIAVREYFNE